MRNRVLAFVASLALVGCVNVPAPKSAFPNARAAIERMRATASCATGVQAFAKLDHSGERGRIRGDLDLIVSRPARIRMDVSSFGVVLAVLTSDGNQFALSSTQDHQHYEGPASACNIARLTTVPMPGQVLVNLLRGVAPVVEHKPDRASIIWDKRGYYAINIAGDQADETIELTPHPDDVAKPWSEQRVRVREVSVRQQQWILYEATLEEHSAARTAKTRVDSAGIDPDIPPSGGACDAELPRKIHLRVPEQSDDVRLRYSEATWNPPLPDDLFVQGVAPGMKRVHVDCR